MLSDPSKSHTPTKDDIAKIAADTLGVIERDCGKPMDARLKAVLVHWLSVSMTEVRNKTVEHHKQGLQTMLDQLGFSASR